MLCFSFFLSISQIGEKSGLLKKFKLQLLNDNKNEVSYRSLNYFVKMF